jgi:hypothetical protein
MIDVYLNQTATWKKVTGLDGYGQPVTQSEQIKVRWDGFRKLVRDKQGQQVVSEGRVFCIEPVQTGDILNDGNRDWTIITVSTLPDLNGNILFYEAEV